MTATILHFPIRKTDAGRLAIVSALFADTMSLPSRATELDMLIQIGGKLLDDINNFQAIDMWLARLDALDG